MSRWTVDQVVGLAPDGASVSAGRKLAVGGGWAGEGCDERAVWALAQGNGNRPYQVVVDLIGPAYKCSCPSRKIPCKHVLGLLDGGIGRLRERVRRRHREPPRA
jgi:uncharacterized Zn finger protein